MASRYDIITGNTPEIPDDKKPQEKGIVSFGFDADIGRAKFEEISKRAFFRPRVGDTSRIAFISPGERIFTGAKVH